MVASRKCSFVTAAVLSAAILPSFHGFVAPAVSIRTAAAPKSTKVTMMAGPPPAKFDWVPIVSLKEAPSPGTAKSVFVTDLDLCIAADDKGLLYVLGNKCPPANQPLSFSLVVNNCLKDPVLGTKINIETGDVVEWCPSLLGKLLSPILGPEPANAGVNVFKVRSKGGNLEAYLQVNAREQYESSYWTGILDAQGKADGGYY